MADHSFSNIGLCILPQSAYGTVNTTITGLTDTITTADGLVVGSGETGEGDSGIELAEHLREGLELARVGNSAVADSFIREEASGLKITVPMAGARNTADNPTVDGNFNLGTHWPGMDAILKAAGLAGANDGSGVGYVYSPTGDATYASVAAWFGGIKVVYQDVLAKLVLTPTPGEIGLLAVEFDIGSVYSWGTQALTTITQGNQATAGPVVKAVANSYGAARPFESCEITIEPSIDERPDSNATAGIRKAQSGVDILLKTLLYAYTADRDHDRDRLIESSASTADMTFGVPNNTATTNGGVANSYKLALNNLVVRKFKPRKLGTYLGYEIEAEAKAITTAGTEFALTFF